MPTGERFRIDMTGAKELIAALEDISKQMERKVISQTMRQGAKEFAEACKTEAPVGETGELSRTPPKVRALKRQKGLIGFRCMYSRTNDNKYYANPVDRGSKNSGRSKATIPPNPFMERAFAKTAPGLQTKLPEIMAQKLEAVINAANKSK